MSETVEKPYKEELEEWINWANSIMTLHQVRTGTVAETTLAIRKCQRWISHEIETALSAPASAGTTEPDAENPKP